MEESYSGVQYCKIFIRHITPMFISVITCFPGYFSSKLLKMRWTWVHMDPAPWGKSMGQVGTPSCSESRCRKKTQKKLQGLEQSRADSEKIK